MLYLAQGGCGCLPQGHSPSSRSLRLQVSDPFDSHARCTPWSVFQDGRLTVARPAITKGRRRRATKGYNTARRQPNSNGAFLTPINPRGPSPRVALKHTQEAPAPNSPYPGSAFTTVSTHFSWLLFTFPSRYLCAIGHVIIFSLRRSLPPTWRSITKLRDSRSACHWRECRQVVQDCDPLRCRVSTDFHRRYKRRRSVHSAQLGPGNYPKPDSHIEPVPLHSQLLGESWLVSFPPLINMLKSSGLSYPNEVMRCSTDVPEERGLDDASSTPGQAHLDSEGLHAQALE